VYQGEDNRKAMANPFIRLKTSSVDKVSFATSWQAKTDWRKQEICGHYGLPHSASAEEVYDTITAHMEARDAVLSYRSERHKVSLGVMEVQLVKPI
jgi:hypothetical protein